MKIRTLKQQHPLWTWAECIRQSRKDMPPIPWLNIGMGAMVVMLALVIFSQAIHRVDSDAWVCTRAGYMPVKVRGEYVQGAPCLEETHIRSGAVRNTKLNRMK